MHVNSLVMESGKTTCVWYLESLKPNFRSRVPPCDLGLILNQVKCANLELKQVQAPKQEVDIFFTR